LKLAPFEMNVLECGPRPPDYGPHLLDAQSWAKVRPIRLTLEKAVQESPVREGRPRRKPAGAVEGGGGETKRLNRPNASVRLYCGRLRTNPLRL
jgi:hypothetical protein